MENFQLMHLPYQAVDIEPYMSSRTIEFHHGKHHATYVANANRLIKGTKYEGFSLEQVIEETYKNNEFVALFNNVAQVYNHNLFWNSITSKRDLIVPSDKLLHYIEKDLGGFEKCILTFKDLALSRFGSGWAWLCFDKADKKLKLISTSNAEVPVSNNVTPLMTVDVWEHAYYLDYQNRRGDYLDIFFKHLANWDFASKTLHSIDV